MLIVAAEAGADGFPHALTDGGGGADTRPARSADMVGLLVKTATASGGYRAGLYGLAAGSAARVFTR
jgi:hypothetical protein